MSSVQELPTLTLAPWELPPDSKIPLAAPADMVFETFWNEQRVEVWVREVVIDGYKCFFYRESKDRSAGNWLIYSHQVKASDGTEQWFQPLKDKPGTPNWPLQRLFHFDGKRYGFPGNHRLVISPKIVTLVAIGKQGARWSEFDWSDADFRQMRATEVGRAFRVLLDEPTSSARRALEWAQLSWHEQQTRALRFKRGDMEEMKMVMGYVFKTQTAIWQDDLVKSWGCRRMHKSIREAEESEYYGTSMGVRDSEGNLFDYSDVPPRFERWNALFQAYFTPIVPDEFRELVDSVYLDLERISVEMHLPTQHEILEAHTALSEWLRPKVSPKQFEQLMFDTDDEFVAEFNF